MKKSKSKRPLLERLKFNARYIPLYIMLLPALCYVAMNNYAPLPGLILSFKQFNAQKGIYGSDWADPIFKNFTFLFQNQQTGIMFRNTILYNVGFMIINLIIAVTLAIIITEIRNDHARHFAQAIILFPYVVSIIIVSYMVRGFLDASAGVINHLFNLKTSWYDIKGPWPFILIFVNAWKGVGYGTVLYIAAILGIDASLYESAALDGASRLQQIWYITLPFLKPTMITVTLMGIGHIFNSDFGLFYQVPQNSGLIKEVTQTLDTYIFNGLSTNTNIGMTAAASFFQSVVGFCMILIFNGITRKVSNENALF